jgi:hypothetical protein
MTKGLDGRHRDKNGQIERKRSDTRMETLKPTYPVLGRFPDGSTLGEVLERQGADSLSDLLRQMGEAK